MSSRSIGVVGGTGPLGRGLAARLAVAGHEVFVGSRQADRAQAAIEKVRARLGDADLWPAANDEACARADLVFVTVPYDGQETTLRPLAGVLDGKVVVSCVNPVAFDDAGPHVVPVPGGSAAQECQAVLGERSRVVSALHTVPASALLRVPEAVGSDTVVCGDDDDAKRQVLDLLAEIPGLRPLDGGPLRLSAGPEAMTATLLAMNSIYGGHAGLRIEGLPAPG
jgi:8-hydroxy-5-deazaflavin:NADPH oxidoreductase